VSVPRSVAAVRAIKVRPDGYVELPEHLATEEPMQILLAGPGQGPEPLAVTMRTPGHDFELAAGFVVTEGLADRLEIRSVDYCENRDRPDGTATADHPEARYNHVTVHLTREWIPSGPGRVFVASASCGMCGKASIDQVEANCCPVAPSEPINASIIPRLPDRLRLAQKAFDRTGGLHAAGLFDPDGNLWCAREDVGRHNAVDKVAGHTVLAAGRPNRDQGGQSLPPTLGGWVLTVSGRVSFEIVQKAALAGIGTIAAVSAPSSLAVEAAHRLGVALLAFVRGETFNVYSHPERLVLPT
jgi:FdhD protein